ncbi:MAG: hypothetical protein AAB388_03135 [Patescibacteria group bacterium]
MNEGENYNLLKQIINEVDPIGLIDHETPESFSEYNAELNEILKEDISHLNDRQLGQLIYEVFVRFFNEDLVGSKDKYNLIASKFLADKK